MWENREGNEIEINSSEFVTRIQIWEMLQRLNGMDYCYELKELNGSENFTLFLC